MTPADVAAVTAANAELYASFEAGDIDRMAAVWDDGDDVACVHPGWPVLRGRPRILRSWTAIMANTPYIQFFLTDVQAGVDGNVAVVTCEESILTGAGDLAGETRVATTNVFRRRQDGWRLWVHHGSPVVPVDDGGPDPGELG